MPATHVAKYSLRTLVSRQVSRAELAPLGSGLGEQTPMHDPLDDLLPQAGQGSASLQYAAKPVSRFTQLVLYLIDVDSNQGMVALAPPAGDHHGFDIGDVRVQRGGDGIVRRPQVQGAGVDGDQVGLHAGLDAADAVGEAERSCPFDSRPRQRLLAGNGRLR